MKAFSRAGIRSRAALLVASAIALAGLPMHAQLSVGSYHLQSSTRVSTYQYDYTYTADVANNSGATRQTVTGTVTSSAPSTIVEKATVQFGPVAANQTVTSTDTFVIRQDRRVAFNPASLTWNLQSAVSLPAGTVAQTANPQVALYTVNLPAAGSVTVRFGTNTSYGRQTWSQSRTTPGPVAIQVAGMLANTAYHMQAAVLLQDGGMAMDTDHTFTTGSPTGVPTTTVTTTAGMQPQPGVEQITYVSAGFFGISVTDLAGRSLWSYQYKPTGVGEQVEGVKMLPNGHFLITLGLGNTYPLQNKPNPAGSVVSIREIDLTGATVRELTVADLNNRLHAAGYPQVLQQFHHDIAPLPNGHILVLSNTVRTFNGLQGYPNGTQVLADTVVDLDQNMQPVWVWDEFDHLDVNRHPFSFPDLTHTNAVVYSPTDGNLIISIRDQNWVVKVDYRNGQGTGGILWRLGNEGDFTLKNGVSPTDWEYAQHYPSLFTPNSAGVFSIGLMDNGDDRMFPTGTQCDTAGFPACHYTTIPVYQIDENAKTATLTFHQILPLNLYSFFGGNTELLANGNIEYAESSTTPSTDSDIFEVTNSSTPQTVWHLHTNGVNAYRGYRIPSLYPGVQWQQ